MQHVWSAVLQQQEAYLHSLGSLSCICSFPEVDKGIHAPREGDDILHRAKLLKGAAQEAAGQALVQVAQPQVP